MHHCTTHYPCIRDSPSTPYSRSSASSSLRPSIIIDFVQSSFLLVIHWNRSQSPITSSLHVAKARTGGWLSYKMSAACLTVQRINVIKLPQSTRSFEKKQRRNEFVYVNSSEGAQRLFGGKCRGTAENNESSFDLKGAKVWLLRIPNKAELLLEMRSDYKL